MTTDDAAPRLSGLAALGLTGLMTGAVVTHVVVLDGELFYVPAAVGVVAALIARVRRDQTARLRIPN